ncbi:MAG: hypothetical protein VX672_04980 [Planctomycetota bacterium]|nr:hypothetical protein [Planctomycetota bacterium]
MRKAEGSSLHKAARHLWRGGGDGDRSIAIPLLTDDLQANRSMRSLVLLLALATGLDRRTRLTPKQGDRRPPPDEASAP